MTSEAVRHIGLGSSTKGTRPRTRPPPFREESQRRKDEQHDPQIAALRWEDGADAEIRVNREESE